MSGVNGHQHPRLPGTQLVRLAFVAVAVAGGGGSADRAELNVADAAPDGDAWADAAPARGERANVDRATKVFAGGAARTAALIRSGGAVVDSCALSAGADCGT